VIVLDPTGESSIETLALAPRLSDLHGKTVWFCDNQGEQWGRTEPELNPILRTWRRRLEAELAIRSHHVCTEQFTSPYRHGREKFDHIVSTASAVINGLACCGSGTSALIHDAVRYEQKGIATVSVVTDTAEPFARAAMRKLGMADLKYIVVSHNIHMFAMVSTLAEAEAEAERLYPQVLRALVR
jgi:hypothetical protein